MTSRTRGFGSELCLSVSAVTLALVTTRPAAAQTPVHVVSDDITSITLEQVTGEASTSVWGPGGEVSGVSQSHVTVCTGPCDTPLNMNAKYFISGSGVHDSTTFVIPRGTTNLKVSAGSQVGWMLGVFSFSFGGGAVAGGVPFLFFKKDEGLRSAGTMMACHPK